MLHQSHSEREGGTCRTDCGNRGHRLKILEDAKEDVIILKCCHGGEEILREEALPVWTNQQAP
jgi:hypothetical protein